MKFNSPKQLKDWLKNKELSEGISPNTLLNYYMMERLLERISVSKYNDNFIFKGGFLISSMIGINLRSTLDIDATLKGIPISEEKIMEIVNNIISIELDDNISFNIINIKSIHSSGKYEDFRITIEAKFFNVKEFLKIDLTTGDVVIPKEIEYSYTLMFEERTINIRAYHLYTVLAEKLETVLSRNIANTRAKDFYDIYTLTNLNREEIVKNSLIRVLEERCMKSYIINIELIGSNPLIWRKVVLPAGATFNRLNDVIQNVTNFQSGYPNYPCHLFEFDLGNLIVTNDEEAYLEHQHYKKNKKMYEERLKTMPKDLLEFEITHQEKIMTEVRKPTTVKIDRYLEEFKEIRYNYDFGDGWQFVVKLENMVDDYYFGFPTSSDGAETAPPEDVVGIYGFYEFLKIYNDTTHPKHTNIKKWADSSCFKKYKPELINDSLKSIKYKKIEWDKINHNRYIIIKWE